MQQTTQANDYKNDEIDLKKIFDQLLASKMLIIVITLIFTILATYIPLSKPPSFISTALIEIGHYVQPNKEDGQNILIENAEDLILELNIDFVQDQQIIRPSFIREASIVPVPEIEAEQSNVVPQSKIQEIPKTLKKNKPLKKDTFKLFENDLEKMMGAMRDKIKNKKMLSKNK